ncbi:copia protein [Tanacetum coccineum]
MMCILADINATLYRDMIGSLMYLTSSRPDLIYAVCLCARYQEKPTKKHLQAVKRIFRYLKGTINMGLCWSSKKQKSTAISSTEAEYISLPGCCAQILWMRSQLTNYGFQFNKILLYCDNKSTIALSCNNVQYLRAKHIDVHYHFIKDQVENGITTSFTSTKLEKIHHRFDKLLDDIIHKHKARKVGKDEVNIHLLMDALLKVKEHGSLKIPLAMDKIKAIMVDVISASSDTSSTVVEWAMSEQEVSTCLKRRNSLVTVIVSQNALGGRSTSICDRLATVE